MVTVVRVTPVEAALHASSTEQSTKNDGGKKHGLPLPCDSLSRDNNDENLGGNKRPLPPEHFVSDREITKRQKKADGFILDLSDVPPQPPILKREGHNIKEGASKYVGVTFHKPVNKWHAKIKIEGKKRHIGYYSYENEEEAAVDYARAVFKYKGQEALDKARERKSSSISIDLSDVPPQLPIPKSKGRIKEGASKYTGVSFDKSANKWKVEINIDGKQRHIGYYESEEKAAIDYARAVFKYRRQGGNRQSEGTELVWTCC